MSKYIIYFNQAWVGDHTEAWFAARGPLARAVVDDMKAAGAYVFAGGLEEDLENAFSADATSGTLTFTKGPYVRNPPVPGRIRRDRRGRRGGSKALGWQIGRSMRLAAGGSPGQVAVGRRQQRRRR